MDKLSVLGRLSWLVCLIPMIAFPGTLETYPLASYAKRSAVFALSGDGKEIPVQLYQDYHYAHFSMSGTVELIVTSDKDIGVFDIRPHSRAIKAVKAGRTLRFSISESGGEARPNYLVIEIAGQKEMVILADPSETAVPVPGAPGVRDVTAAPYSADGSGAASAQASLQQAIDEASAAGGGVVYVPSGTYLVRQQLKLKSNVHLYLAGGAVLKASAIRSDYGYPIAEVLSVNGQGCKVTGRGAIDASGFALMAPSKGFTSGSEEHPRRRVINTRGSKDLLIEGILVKDATGWSVEVEQSESVVVRRVKVLNHKDIEYKIENDGINSVLSSHTLFTQCFVMTIDDAMCAKARGTGSMTDVRFSRNVLYTWAGGVKAGMQAESPMRDVWFTDIDIIHCRRGIAVESRTGTSAMEDIHFQDIRVERMEPTLSGSENTIDIHSHNSPIRNIEITRASFEEAPPILVHGGFPIENIRITDLRVAGKPVLSASDTKVTGESRNLIFLKGTGVSLVRRVPEGLRACGMARPGSGRLYNRNGEVRDALGALGR